MELPMERSNGQDNSSQTKMDEPTTSGKMQKKGCCASCWKWIGSPSFFIYLNYFMSQWGDWMWQFAVGLYLVRLSGGELRLAAIFGFSGGGCVLLFGGIIGDWVDRNGRLKVVRVSLVLQNMSVMFSAICVGTVLVLEPNVISLQYGQVGRQLMEVAIIVFAISAQLSNVAYTIAIEKDWIVVIAEEKSSNLANLNAGTRSLALVCKILSPAAVGFIMTYDSLWKSAIVIAGWNLVSVFIEYAILSHVYAMVPRLAVKKSHSPDQEKEMKLISPEAQPMNRHETEDKEQEKPNTDGNSQSIESTFAEKNEGNVEYSDQPVEKPEKKTCVEQIFEPFLLLVRGWRTYARQTVVYAGVSLAFLYMTVLGFDSITLGYIYANNVSELIVGICMALAGLTGIIGTILFTRLRKRLGLEITGLIAYSAEISCLVFAVISIWTPGSRFDPYYATRSSSQSNCSSPNTSTLDNSGLANGTNNQTDNLWTVTQLDLSTSVSSSGVEDYSCQEKSSSHTSIILLLVGIISSRVGLWMADLVVTQLMQETIYEKERGIVNGVQNSLNMLMDMLKFVLVIVAPKIEIFGFHIIISFAFICMAGLFFVGHVIRVRKSRKKNGKSYNTAATVQVDGSHTDSV